MLILTLQVNSEEIGAAFAVNTTKTDNPISDYSVSARTSPHGERERNSFAFDIEGHDRNQSVWALVEKIAQEMQAQEKYHAEKIEDRRTGSKRRPVKTR
jgi:ferric-dicitrate binding protein FerR (iron transport regulator)